MKNNKTNFYKDLLLDNYYWGGALNITTQVDLNLKEDVINALDEVCKNEKLTPLGKDWNEISYNQFKETLVSALQFNLGFTNHEVMPNDKAQQYYKNMTKYFDFENCRCFTNGFDSPWNNSTNGYSFNSVSSHTIDLALSIINKDKVLLIYFLFED